MARNPFGRDRASTGGVVVLGLGRFGASLALELVHEGVEVLGIDSDRRIVESMTGQLTHVVEADCTDEEAMRQLSVHEFDRAVIGMGSSLEASILTASVLVELGIGSIWAKAIGRPHARILEQVGVHHVVRPEHDMGRRLAHLVRSRALDYIELEDGYAFCKVEPPEEIVGRPLSESRVRSTFEVTVVGIKRAEDGFTYATPETVVEKGDLVIVSGTREKVEAFVDQCC